MIYSLKTKMLGLEFVVGELGFESRWKDEFREEMSCLELGSLGSTWGSSSLT